MAKRVVVLGAGPGGYVAAIRAAQLGGDVTLLEKEDVGGTCLHWGCIPSKILKTTADMLVRFRRAGEFGITVDGNFGLDMKNLMARKDRVVQDQAKGIRTLLDHHKVSVLQGEGCILDSERVKVRSKMGEIRQVPWDRLILAMGSRAADLPNLPFDGERVLSSNDAFLLRELPASLMILGGGVIGCEFASIFSALGVQVTLVEGLSRLLPLPSVDEGCSKVLQREMKKQKIEFMVNRTVDGMVRLEEGCQVTLGPSPFGKNPKESDRKVLTREVSKILVCVGRKPNTEAIGLERIGVKTDEKGWITCNERMETSTPGVYAIGDVLGPSRPMLAHVASREGIVAAENAMGEGKSMAYHAVPGAIFTMPEVANVGLTETQARERGYGIRVDSVLFRNLGKAHVIGEIAGEAKVISDAVSGRILGVHLVGPHANDLIAEGVLALQTGCAVQDLADAIHAHPTLPEIMMEVALKAMDRSLHG